MLEKFKQKWYDRCLRWSKVGMMMPYWYDPVTKQPSITIMFAYISFHVALLSVIAYHFNPALMMPTTTAIGFWTIAVVFYMLRKITKAKVDLKNRSFEITNEPTKRSGSYTISGGSDTVSAANTVATDGTQAVIDNPDANPSQK